MCTTDLNRADSTRGTQLISDSLRCTTNTFWMGADNWSVYPEMLHCWITSIRTVMLHGLNGSMSHVPWIDPSISPSSCYSSPSSILPYIPIHLSGHFDHINVGSGNLRWQHGLWDGWLGPELAGGEYRIRHGEASSPAIPTTQGTFFHRFSIVHTLGNNFLFHSVGLLSASFHCWTSWFLPSRQSEA